MRFALRTTAATPFLSSAEFSDWKLMPLKITVGLSQKVGQPRFGSVGASCQVEFEADSPLLKDDLAGFHQQVQSAYRACRQAVQEELQRSNAQVTASPRRDDLEYGSASQSVRGERRQSEQLLSCATPNQIRAIHTLANRLELDLNVWLPQKFGVSGPGALSLRDAGRAIDELQLLQAVAAEALAAHDDCPLPGTDQMTGAAPG
jgi:hypothetical protein